jgi:diaminohydroxyphosphoribosylaminopyrimidine deaminase / 5-amino-6-(5-phosphoribosylamino)uracil reductase
MLEQNQQDAHFMARALYLARKGLYTTDPNPRVGCVLVKNGRVIGEGWHKRSGEAHAEVDALNNATENPEGATAYVTLEPCSHHGKTPPCCDALIKSGIKRVVAAMQDPNPLVAGKGFDLLQQAGISVQSGVLEADARELNRGFIMRMSQSRPFVRSKLAMSLDGRTAMASGESKWITSEESRADVQRLRAESSAILTGINTVLADDPSLTARIDEEVVQPVRVILDSNLQMPLTAKMLGLPGRTLILTCNQTTTAVCSELAPQALPWVVEEHNKKMIALQNVGAEVFQLPRLNGRLDLHEVIKFLAQQQINQVLVEAGAILNGGLLQANLVDEWVIYMAPKILGDQGRGLFHLPGLEKLVDSKEIEIQNVLYTGKDLKITLAI